MRITVEAIYNYNKYGLDHDKDDRIRKAAKRADDGSGVGFGERDITFTFYRRDAAQRAVERMRKIRGVRAKVLLSRE